MKKTIVCLLSLMLLLSAVLPMNTAALEPDWSRAGMKKESILLQPRQDTAQAPAVTEPVMETFQEETAEYVAPMLNADDAAKDGAPLSGKYAENCTWVFEDGVLTVSGIGGTRVNNQYDEVPRNLEIKELVVESGVLFVHENFCFEWPYLEKVTIADTVESLGENCFAYCPKLKELNLPSTLKGIHAGCFEGSGIEEIVIPEGVEFLGRSAFADCQELTTVTFPDSHISIGDHCFAQCPKLKTLQLPEGLEHLPGSAFRSSGLVEIEIPHKVKKLQNYIFGECSDLEKIVIPPSVSEMRTCGLHTCENVTIYCWEYTAAHLYALEREIPYVLMEEPPEDDVYDITLASNELGTVKISSLRTTAGSPISVEAIPDSDTVMPFIEVYYFSEEELDIQLVQFDNTQVDFQMPPCEVLVKVLFLDLNNPFWDVTENDYFLVPVLWARSMNITSGVSANAFAPNDACTRGQVVTFLWRAAGEPEPQSSGNPFWDVQPGDYYYDAVLWAVENGITNGVGPGEFAPYASCTRGQIVTFLWRALGSPEPLGYDHPFVDIDPAQYYYNSVLWAVEYGVTNGTSETTFSPGDICTRGQIVTFLFRTLA